MRKSWSKTFVFSFLALLIILQISVLYIQQQRQIKDFLNAVHPLLEILEPDEIGKVLKKLEKKGLVQAVLLDRDLRPIKGNFPIDSWTIRQDLNFVRDTKVRVFNMAKGYEIFPLQDKFLVIRINALSPRYFILFWWPFWALLLLLSLSLWLVLRNRMGEYKEELYQCREFFRQFLDIKQDLPLSEVISLAQKKIQQTEDKIQRQQTEIQRLSEDLEELNRKLRKTIQDLESTQDSLIQAGSLMALGEFAAGISHELNNPLGIVLGFAQYLLDEIPKDHPHYSKLKRMETELQRAQKIIQDLLAFARPAEPRFQYTDINQLVKDTVQFVFYPKVPGIEVECHLDESLPPAYVDPDQIEQVLINLFKNAVEAMPEGGILRIKTSLDQLSPEDCFQLSLPLVQPTSPIMSEWTHDFSRRLPKIGQNYEPGHPAIRIDISDTGTGIAKKDLQKIFTPFFTTKKRGTGLGLSICWKLIRRNGGLLKVQSILGKGTTFSIILPLKEQGHGSER